MHINVAGTNGTTPIINVQIALRMGNGFLLSAFPIGSRLRAYLFICD
jgi:hypothetical protein